MSQQRRSVQHLFLSVYFIFYFWIWFIIVSVLTGLFRLLLIRHIKNFISKRKNKKPSVLYLEVFSPQGAGNRHRAAKWVNILNQNGFKARSEYVVEYNEYLRLTSQKETVVFFFIEFLWRRLLQCLFSIRYDVVIVRRELLMFNDYGYLFFERMMFYMHPHLLLDFDDDISAAKREPKKISRYGKLLLEHPQKFTQSLKYFSGFIPATDYLKQLLTEKRKDVNENQILVVPTCVDYDLYPPKDYSQLKEEIAIGWVGAKGNLNNVLQVIPALNELSNRYKFSLLIVCDQPLNIHTSFPVRNIPWSEKDEIQNFHLIDIGIMPLQNDVESRGKAGLKLIQYMGCGIVSIATALTVNNEIVDDEVNGFLVAPDANWTSVFEKVFQQKQNFSEIGKSAYKKIAARYSFTAHKESYIRFLHRQIRNN